MRTHQPTMAWHPKTGENQVFDHPDDVPADWLDTHPDNVKAKAPVKAAPASATPGLPLTRDEIVKALSGFEIPFRANAKDKALYDLLEKSLREHFATEKVEVPPGADVPALLALVASKSE